MAKHRRKKETPVNYGTLCIGAAVVAGVVLHLVRRVRVR